MPRARKTLYKLTAGEQEILDKVRRERNPNWLTNYYLRQPGQSGTYWREVSSEDLAFLKIPEFKDAALRWQNGYSYLYDSWKRLGQPDYFYPEGDNWIACREGDYLLKAERLERVYRTTLDDDTGGIVFHHPHGLLLIPWQLDMYRARQPIDVVVGGFGSAKTWAKIIHMMVRAVLLPGYRGFVLAPYSIQSTEVFTQANTIMTNTLFEERFLIRSVTKPFSKLEIGHQGVGSNSIEFFPILDNPDKIRNLSGDEGMVDQVEAIPDINELVRNLGTRLRGQYQGRPRLGKMSLIANPADNPELWDWFDDGANAPDEIWTYAAATHENTYLTVSDLKRFQRQVGEGEEDQAMYLFGRRPKGSGKHFPAASIEKFHREYLDDIMREGLAKGLDGYIKQERPKAGVVRWEIPPEDDHEYLVIADPGWSNPPYRNSPVVGVWDISSFLTGGPATLVAFAWVYGRNSPNPWISQYMDFVLRYKAVGSNAYDATGFQSVYQSLADKAFEGLLAEPLALPGQKKLSALNLAKKMMADGRFAAPSIPHMYSQLAKYDLPDDKLRQDIVAFILVTAQWLERLYYINTEEAKGEEPWDIDDRHFREIESESERYVGRTHV